MLKSKKHDAPDFFKTYIHHHHPDSWGQANPAERKHWHDYILTNEQDGLSLYTEVPCTHGATHIDHFRRRTDFPQLTFEWGNLVVDTNSNDYGARYKDRERPDYSLLLNPVSDTPERYFSYRGDGFIVASPSLSPVDERRARYTIDTFNLNHPQLVYKRKQVFDTFLGVPPDDVPFVVEAFRTFGFPSVVRQIIDGLS